MNCRAAASTTLLALEVTLERWHAVARIQGVAGWGLRVSWLQIDKAIAEGWVPTEVKTGSDNIAIDAQSFSKLAKDETQTKNRFVIGSFVIRSLIRGFGFRHSDFVGELKELRRLGMVR